MPLIYSASGSIYVSGENKIKLLVARRSRASSFFPDFYVLPGGRVDATDLQLFQELKLNRPELHQIVGKFPEGAYRITFLREFFEEVGILLTKTGPYKNNEELIADLRTKLVNDEISFKEVLNQLHFSIDQLPLSELTYIGTRITPPFSPKIYYARYYLFPVDHEVQPHPFDSELIDARWIFPQTLLTEWKQLKVKISPPTLQQLRYFAKYPFDIAVKKLIEDGDAPFGVKLQIEFVPNVELIPLPSNTLPPATTTNFVIMGGSTYYVIDPGTNTTDGKKQLNLILERLNKQKRELLGIIITHHHKDHHEAVVDLVKKYQVPIFAHQYTAENLSFDVDTVLTEKTLLEVKDCDDIPYTLEVLPTPGHTRGSISIYDSTHRTIAVGDLMAGIGTVVINPPEGNLRDYLNSLRLLQTLYLKFIIPGHGPPILDPQKKIAFYIQHRMERHEKIREAIKNGADTLMKIVKFVYTDVPSEYHQLAARSVLAHLLMMQEEGEISEDFLEKLKNAET